MIKARTQTALFLCNLVQNHKNDRKIVNFLPKNLHIDRKIVIFAVSNKDKEF